MTLIMVGLDNAGKTATVRGIQGGKQFIRLSSKWSVESESIITNFPPFKSLNSALSLNSSLPRILLKENLVLVLPKVVHMWLPK